MPPADSAALIVARFLKSNQYLESYEAFIGEAGLPEDAGDVSKGDLTLETLLEEKKTFDLSLRFEKLGTGDEATGWTRPAPSEDCAISSLPSRSNILSATVEGFVDAENNTKQVLLSSSADRRLHTVDTTTFTLQASLSGLQDSPILSCAVLRKRILLSSSMSGQLVASDLDGNIFDKRRDNSKFVVRVAIFDSSSSTQNSVLIATAGWDNNVTIYQPFLPDTNPPTFHFGEPKSTISLPSKPESLLFIRHPSTSEPILLLTRTDSSFLFYYATTPSPRLLGKQNLAPHSNTWVAFTPSAIALCPTDPTLLAVGTSTVPHMKLLLVRLMVPPYDAPAPPAPLRSSLSNPNNPTPPLTQASQALAALAVADREAAAIQIHCTSMAPQTAYSTPAVAWRPDGSGVWVNGDDGAIRGVEASTGKVVITLKGGHEEGSKVRCLWAGSVDGEEWLVSGGFDQRLVVWTAASGGDGDVAR